MGLKVIVRYVNDFSFVHLSFSPVLKALGRSLSEV